jgi:DNA-binding NarL/FixJ family response regulator
MTARVVIVDDHPLVRQGLKTVLETNGDIRVVGMASDGREAVTVVLEHQPDVVYMDVSMPGLNGIEATGMIRKKSCAKVIILSMHQTQEHVQRALNAGANGYILKESAPDEVIQACQSVMLGHRYLGRGVPLPPLRKKTYVNQIDCLSRREREVLQLVVEGKRNPGIASILGVTSKSIETYRSRIMNKLEVYNVPTLVKLAITNGIISPED